ncbi:MAG: hypothetical protein WEF86_08840 [Gemmatimonadota bacterium]
MTRIDADAAYLALWASPTGVLSVPNRYMHSPNEIVSLADLEATARLIAAFCSDISDADDFVPR